MRKIFRCLKLSYAGLCPLWLFAANPAAAADPMFYLVVSGKSNTVPELSEVAKRIADQLQFVVGVKQIDMVGEQRHVLRIRFDHERLAAFGLSQLRADEALFHHQLKVSQGHIGSGIRELTSFSAAEFPPVKDLSAIVLKVEQGVPVRLGDVASIEIGAEDPRIVASLRGDRVVALGVHRGHRINSFWVSLGITMALAKLQSQLPQGVALELVAPSALTFQSSRLPPRTSFPGRVSR